MSGLLIPCHTLHLYRLGRIVRALFPAIEPTATCLGSLVIFWYPPDNQTRIHEYAHCEQAFLMIPKWLPRWRWLWAVNVVYLAKYLWIYRKTGYENHPWEIAARRAAGQVD